MSYREDLLHALGTRPELLEAELPIAVRELAAVVRLPKNWYLRCREVEGALELAKAIRRWVRELAE